MAVAALDLGRPRSEAGTEQSSHVVSPSGVGRVSIVALLRISMLGLLIAQLGRIPVLDSGRSQAPILINDLAVMLVVGGGVLAALRSRRLVMDGPAGFALAFAAVGGISALLAIPRFGLSTFEFLFSFAYLLRWLTYFAIYVVVINFVRKDEVSSVWQALELTILAFAVFGIFQSAFLPGFAQMVYPPSSSGIRWDEQGRRLVSTFLDPNFAGIFIAIGLLILLARMSFGTPTPLWKPLLLFAALVLTLSRGAALAFFVGVLTIALVRGHSRRVIRTGAVMALLLAAATPLLLAFAEPFDRFSMGGSAVYRFIAWVRGVELFLDHPIIGIGFNTMGFVQDQYDFGLEGVTAFGLDGGLLFVMVLTGLVGLAIFAGMVVLVMRRCHRIWKDSSYTNEERGLALGIAAVTIAWVVDSLFVNSLFYPFLMEPVWILWGLTFVVSSSTGLNEVRLRTIERSGPRILHGRTGLLAM